VTAERHPREALQNRFGLLAVLPATSAGDPDARLRDIAETVGITERAAQRIVSDLVDAGYVTREREGRRNRYALDRSMRMRHPSQFSHEIGELLDVLRLDDAPDD